MRVSVTQKLIHASRISVFAFAVAALIVQPLLSLNLPAVFAAGPSWSPDAITLIFGETKTTTTSVDGYTGLLVSFDYDINKLEPGDSLNYGWREGVGGTDNPLGTLNGETNTDSNPGPNEIGTENVALPDAAGVDDLVLYFSNTGATSGAADQVSVSGLAIAGTSPVLATAVTNTTSGLTYDSLQEAVDAAASGDTLQLNENLVTSQQVTVGTPVVIDGNGFTLDAAFAKTSNSNNSAIGVQANGVTIRNLTVTSSGDLPYPSQLHGINVYESTSVNLQNITARDFYGTGIAYNSSSGTISDVTTANNTWHGINVDQKTPQGSAVTIEGASSHAEAFADLYVDNDTKNVIVNASAYQWLRSGIPGREYDRVYRLAPEFVAGAESNYTVYGSTTSTENDPMKWFFNRDTSTSSPYNFTTDQSSIGTGSLFVQPIGSNPSDKFIGEYFIKKKLADTGAISFDYRLGDGVAQNKVNHVYANLYVNYESETNYGDCVYNIVAGDGSPGWHTLSVDKYALYDVRTRGTVPSTCPARMVDLPATAYVRALAINVGDTSLNDVDVSAYLDNVRVVTAAETSQYDFEYSPDPNNQNHLNISIGVFHNRNADRDRDSGEEYLAGWALRLYKEDSGAWQLVDEKTSIDDGRVSFTRQSDPGTYHVCEVAQLGWTQIRQDWSGTTYNVTTENESPNKSEEGEWCRTISYDDTRDRSSAGYLGNRYNDQNNQNHLNFTGIVFNNLNGDRDRDTGESVLTDWTVRVYKQGDGGVWSGPIAERTTRSSDNKYAVMLRDATAGVYHVCLVNKSGWTQVEQNWSGTPYHVATDNLSGASDESAYCSTVVFDDSGDRSNAKYFGVQDSAKPQVRVVTPEAASVQTDSFTVSGTSSDAETAVDYVNYTVTKVSGIGGSYVASIASGTTTGTNNWTFDVNGLASGFYRLKVQAFDIAGNWKYDHIDVQVDSNTPALVLNEPNADRTISLAADAYLTEGTATDENGVNRVVLYVTDENGDRAYRVVTRDFDSSTGAWSIEVPSGALADGEYTFNFNAYDNAGNLTTVRHKVTVDSTAPLVAFTRPTKTNIFLPGNVTIQGTVDDPAASKVNVNFNGETKQVDVDASGQWSALFENVPNGQYDLVATAEDVAGNVGEATITDVPVDAVPVSIITPQLPTPTSPENEQTGGNGVTTQTPLQQLLPFALITPQEGVQVQTAGGATQTDTTGIADTEVLADESSSQSDRSVKSAETTGQTQDDDESATWSIFGLAWYWWLLILAAITGLMVAVRARSSDGA